jgi:hypothetical protein
LKRDSFLYKKIHGIIRAICNGLEIKFGIKPEKIKKMWKIIEIKPRVIHIFLYFCILKLKD